MQHVFFYGSIAAVWILLIASGFARPIRLRHVLTGIAALGYSTLFDCFFGIYMGLYYYLNASDSIIYVLISALLLYPELDVIYILFLPKNTKTVFVYTAAWLAAMLLFEIASLRTLTIVFTGWTLFPWSVVTYLFTFTWLNLYYRYLQRKGL